MSREVRRVPPDWQHPMEWGERWDGDRVRMQLVPRPLWTDFAGSLASWEQGGRDIEARAGFDWEFWSEYCLTGYQGPDDDGPTIHPFEGGVDVRDADHLHELLTAKHAAEEPDPSDYMPEFSDDEARGWCMYETVSEGTPISPVLESPEALARWLADNNASAFGYQTATYEQWLATCLSGSAPSAIFSARTGLVSGVEYMAEMEASR